MLRQPRPEELVRTWFGPVTEAGRIVALVLTRAAAGLGGALGGIGLVHLVFTGNPWGVPVLVGGVALMLYGIRQAARLADRGTRQ